MNDIGARPTLVVLPETPVARTYALEPGTTSIGRTQDNDIVVAHKSLSRRHARVEMRANGEVALVDLGSKNGTTVDGERITARKLGGSAHRIQLGEVPATFFAAGIAREIGSDALPSPSMSFRSELFHASLGELLAARGDSSRSPVARSSAIFAERERDRLRVLLKVSQLLSTPKSLDDVLTSLLDLAFEILDIDRAAVLLCDAASGELEARAVRCRPGARLASATYSRTVARWVIAKGEAALFTNAMADARLAEAGSIADHSIKATMAAPLLGREATHGALYIDNLSVPDGFCDEDLEFLSAFACQAAIAIENAMLHERLAAEAATRQGLLRFFPPSMVPALMGAGAANLAIVETEATALFSDITGYTELSARMPPIEVIRLLNEYFPIMAEIVFRHEGTLEKYIGDALLAVWGTPIAHDDDPLRAVLAAIDMQRAVRSLNRAWAGRRTLSIHIGLNTGPVAAGNIGSSDYVQYATIGDATNVASRICDLAGAGEILIDGRTAAKVRATGLDLEPLGRIALKGKEDAHELFRVEWSAR